MEVEHLGPCSRAVAEAQERAAIQAENPKYNIVGVRRPEWVCRTCGKQIGPATSGVVVLIDCFSGDRARPVCDQIRCAGTDTAGVHPCDAAGMPCYGNAWLVAFLRFQELWLSADTTRWYAEHLNCGRPLASNSNDFVIGLEQARRITNGDLPTPGYAGVVFSTEYPRRADE